MLAAGVACRLLAGTVFAADGSWVGPVGDTYWTNSANWDGGVIAGGTNATAWFVNDFAGSLYADVTTDRVIGNLVFSESDPEHSSIFSDAEMVQQKLRQQLPDDLRDLPIRVDIARHIFRPHTRGPAAGQNFLYDSARDQVRPLTTNQLFPQLPVSHRICRVYAEDNRHAAELAAALDRLIGPGGGDDLTNM